MIHVCDYIFKSDNSVKLFLLPCEMMSTLKEKIFSPGVANYFLLEMTLYQKGLC